MKQFEYTIKDEQGIHARPAMMLVSAARKFQSDIKVSYNGYTVDAKDIIKLLMLHANQGAEVTFLIEGSDEEEAYEKIKEFCSLNL